MQIDILRPYKLVITAKITFNFIRIKKNVKKGKHKMHHMGNISLLAKKKKEYPHVHNLSEVATYF